MTKKKELTLQDLLNKMDTMETLCSDMINNFEAINFKLDHLCGEPHPDNAEFADIPDTAYVTIKDDDTYVGGKPATRYNGENIYNRYHCPAYLKEARDIVRKEYGYELLEIHCLQSSTNGEYAQSDTPVPDSNGTKCWCRVVYKDKNGRTVVSRWVFNDSHSSASVCAVACANDCGLSVQYYSDFRSGVFGSVAN